MDAQLKTLIDRTVPRYTEMVDKEVYYILTAADTNAANLEKTVESIRGFTLDCLDGAVERVSFTAQACGTRAKCRAVHT